MVEDFERKISGQEQREEEKTPKLPQRPSVRADVDMLNEENTGKKRKRNRFEEEVKTVEENTLQ